MCIRDSSLALPDDLTDKRAFYAHVCTVADALLAPSSDSDSAANWVTVLSNAASLLFGSYENYEAAFGRADGRRVNWAGEPPSLALGSAPPPRLARCFKTSGRAS